MSKENNEGVIDLFGKKYHTVGKRIANLGEETKKDYTLITNYDITQYPVVIVKAILTVGTNSYTGHAMGDISDQSLRSKVKGKVLESTETHAIGRALATYGSNGGEHPSADEMLQNSDSKQSGDTPPATEKQINFIKKLCDNVAANHDEYVTDKMTMQDASDRIEKLQSIAQDLESESQAPPPSGNNDEEIPF